MGKRHIAILSAASLLAIATSAVAADLGSAYKAPLPPRAPSWSWTGFYIGGHGGAGWGTTETNANLGPALTGLLGTPVALSLPIASQTANGFLGGVQAGYNYQFGLGVLGVEGDFTWADLKSNSPCLVVFNCSVDTKWTADITARAGVVVDKALVYVKGGAAWAHTDYGLNQSITLGAPLLGVPAGTTATSSNVSDTRIGALFGTGVEYAFTPNWSAKIEYNFMDFGKQTYNFPLTTAGLTSIPAEIKQQTHIIKAGINYRFGY
jgi:outer membrane immunogenic protein